MPFFYREARNVRVGQNLRITGRGQGRVRGVTTDEGAFIVAEGNVRPVRGVSEVCFSFSDKMLGICLMPSPQSPRNAYIEPIGLGEDGKSGVMGRASSGNDHQTAIRLGPLPGWGTYRPVQMANGEIRWAELIS
jgi:hypothetical protein